MKHLVGIRAFKQKSFPGRAELFSRLAVGQNPWAMGITCSDSRYTAEMVMNADPGDLFVLRNAGNMLLPYTGPSEHPSCGASTLEYAVNVLKVNDIFVLGHYGCGVVNAALSRPACVSANRALSCWVDQTRHSVVEAWNGLSEPEQNAVWRAACRDHAVHQMENVLTHPCVKARAEEIRVQTLIFDLLPGDVEEYNPTTGLWSVIGPAEVVGD